MAFGNAWVETDPDGSVITVSQLDNSDRLIKSAVRERLEGDPAAPDLTGLIEVGSFPAAPKPRKGAARIYVDTQANILVYGATKREDGRLAIASDTGRLFHVATAAVTSVKYDAGDVSQGNLAYARLPTGGGVWANGGTLSITGGVTTVAGLTSSADITAQARIVLTTAVGKIVPGATSLSLRNTADGADNLILTDAGLATFRNTLTVLAGGIAVTGASTITGTLGGVTSLTIAGALSGVTTLTLSGAQSGGTTLSLAGPITLTTAISKIVPGATSFAIRNNADGADNLLVTNAGVVVVRTQLQTGGFTPGVGDTVMVGPTMTIVDPTQGGGQLTVGGLGGTPQNAVVNLVPASTGTGQYQVGGIKVVGGRRTGWTAWTGTADRATHNADGPATTTQLGQALKALLDDLITHGLIGP